MIKKLSIFILIIMMVMTLVSCEEEVTAKDLFAQLGFSLDTLSSWQGEIVYIEENRGSFDETYSKVKYDEENPSELLTFINCFEGAQTTEAPSDFVFSVEGMSDYLINFYVDGAEEAALSFYYYSTDNLLTRVIRTYDEDNGVEAVDYEFYTPYGDLYTLVADYREMAIEPEDDTINQSLNQKQLIASVEDEELEERMEYQDDEYEVVEGATTGEIAFEIYDGDLPDDEGTGCKLYTNEEIDTLTDEEVVILARTTDDVGDLLPLLITFVEYNSYYTIITTSEPDMDLMDQLGIEVDNAILLDRADIDKDKYIVFLDADGEVIYVIVPFVS